MMRNAIIVMLITAAAATACLWGRTHDLGFLQELDLLDIPSLDLKIQGVGDYLVFTRQRTFDGPNDALFGRSVIQYDRGGPNGAVHQLSAPPMDVGPSVAEMLHQFDILDVTATADLFLFKRITTTKQLASVIVPLWLFIAIFASYPAFTLVRAILRRRRRRKRGFCVKCGYNLRGLPEPRCPECGREFIQAPSE